MNKTVLSLVEHSLQIYEWTNDSTVFFKARVFDENTGFGVKHLGISPLEGNQEFEV